MSKVPQHCVDSKILLDLKSPVKRTVDRGMTCLFYRFEAKVKTMVKYKGGNEDVAQESLVIAIYAFTAAVQDEKYVHKDKIDAYFLRIAEFKCIDLLRKGKGGKGGGSENNLDDLFPEGQVADDNSLDPLEALIKKESDTTRYEVYDKCMQTLSPKCQERMHRYYVLRQRDTFAYLELGDASAVSARVSRNECKKQLIRCCKK